MYIAGRQRGNVEGAAGEATWRGDGEALEAGREGGGEAAGQRQAAGQPAGLAS